MSADETCPNCGSAIRAGTFTVNEFVAPKTLAAVNLALGEKRTHSCGKCAGQMSAIRDKLDAEIDSRRHQLIAASEYIPIVSIPAPMGWDFRSIGIVSAQSVTGTGMFSDVASAFTDLFGTQSKTYNNKIKGGEDICKAALLLRDRAGRERCGRCRYRLCGGWRPTCDAHGLHDGDGSIALRR